MFSVVAVVPTVMDGTESEHSQDKVIDIPPLPLKTYQWEDVRRAKKRGLYPYTHLSKDPFNEEVDPEEFKMDTLRPKSKSVSPLPKRGVDIQEITEDNKSEDHIRNQLEVEGIVEAPDSSIEDNISQCLDKDEDPPKIVEQEDVKEVAKQEEDLKDEAMEESTKDQEDKQEEHLPEEPGTSKEPDKMEVDEGSRDSRAKSEEPKRKRKLSIESAYSRISLSRLGVMKKLRAARDKLKLPKLPFSKSESKLDEAKKPKTDKKDKKEKTNKEAIKQSLQPTTDGKPPVYIHIPLKPPPGQTDEFSHLEFEDPQAPRPTTPIKTPNQEAEPPKEEPIESTPPTQNGQITNDVQFIFLTAPSDDEVLDDHVIVPESASSDGTFFDGSKLRDFKSLAKGCVEDISPDTKIIFEDVIQVEFVDEHNNPIGTTERTNFLEINEENLPTIEKQLSQRNIIQELQKELTASMDSINKLARARSLKLSSEKSRSSEGLKAIQNTGNSTQEAPELFTPSSSGFKKTMSLRDTRRPKGKAELKPIDQKTIAKVEEITKVEEAQAEEPHKEQVRVVVDEEDGLKLSETAVKMINEELAKEQLPTTTEEQLMSSAKASESLKKKVSFKRRLKQDDPERVYEDVKVTDGKDGKEKDLQVMDISQSMSVDEEKTYLDEKMIKSTSLEEDYNKWSKITDHEYEPVNPPPDDGRPAPSPTQPEEVPKSRPTSMPTSIRIPLTDDLVVKDDDQNMEAEEHLTSEQLQAQIEDKFFNQPTVSTNPTTSDSKSVSSTKEPHESQAKKIQDAMKTQADKIRTKFKNMKRPHISMPPKPNFEKLKMKKPNINMPKIPDQMKLNLPSFTLPKKTSVVKTKVTTKQRQYSTESNVGEPKKKLFDFSTYPRLFHKKKTDDLDDSEGDESATLPRAKKDGKKKKKDEVTEKKKKDSPDVIRIPLHSEESMDREDLDLSSHRYDPDIELENDYVRESQEIHRASPFSTDLSRNRWNHGSFHGHNLHEIEPNEDVKVTDLDNDLDIPQETKVDARSISSSGDVHRRGVLEEINSDEFFLRQKGVSQDNIEMGAYLTSEIREAFRQPVNTLSKMQTDDSFEREIDTSDSIQERKRQIKKPKRKKTPNVSREQIPYDQESEPEEYPMEVQPTRPKRRSKKKKTERVTPYQETIETNVLRKAASDNGFTEPHEDEHHFYDGDFKKEYPQLYENEHMEGIEQPNILLSDPYYQKEMILRRDDENGLPEAPPRKQKSLKSLNSEHDSIIDEIAYANQHIPAEDVEAYRLQHEYIIPTPEHPPTRPSRTRSRTRSLSRANSQPEDEEIEEPCVEEPCVQQTCDYMGYAVIDKSKQREPPLPPPPRKKKSSPSSLKGETKFFTCPRPLKDEAPVRPLRNYSTLIPRQRRSIPHEEKENIDIEQYIEIEDEEEHTTRLHSGDVMKKMKDRPLPAPPRPPRKHKESSKSPFADITHESNIKSRDELFDKSQESEVSVQTEPLPDDFVCEEFVQEKGDKVLTPTKNKQLPIREFEHQETVTHGALIVAPVGEHFEEGPITNFSRSTEKIITIRREVDHEDSEIPEEFKMLRDPQPRVTERIIERHPEQVELLKAHKLQVGDLDVDRLTVNQLLASKIKVSEIDSDSIHVAEINPESGSITIGGIELPASLLQGIMGKLQEVQSAEKEKQEEKNKVEEEKKEEEEKKKTVKEVVEIKEEVRQEEEVKDMQDSIKDYAPQQPEEPKEDTQKEEELQLDEAIRIKEEKVLREQEAAFANEVQMRLEQELLSELADVPDLTPDHSDPENPLEQLRFHEQKKTPIDEEFGPEPDSSEEPPVRPPRQTHRPKFFEEDIEGQTPDLMPSDSTPPPRPPEPFEPYFRSQPPPSFFMLHSPNLREFVDDDIPMPPRRKRLQVPPSRSTSEEEEEPVTPRGRRHRTPEPSIPQLAGQLTRACLTAGEKAFKRLVKHITANVLQNSDGRQDLHVMVVILLVLIAGLLLLSSGEKTVHMHHWEYFNPPRDL